MRLQMSSQVVGACELARAPVAHVRFVAGVEPRVAPQVAQTREHPPALGAHERLRPRRSGLRVRSAQVLPQLRGVRQNFLALDALSPQKTRQAN